MKHLGIYPKITKSYILNKISQEDIMSSFLGFPVNVETLTANSISSPYRTDVHPSCNYYYNPNGKLRFRDHSTKLNYDSFDVVAREIGVGVNTKQGFMAVLEEIAKNFRLGKFEDYDEVIRYEKIQDKHSKINILKRKRLVQYKVFLRKPNYHDADYWKRGKLEIKDLRGVFYIQRLLVSYNNSPFRVLYNYNPKDVCYGYYGRRDKVRKINLWKFYFPLRIKGDERGTRFTTNGSFIQGIQYLKPDTFCVLTKSFKDVKVFNKVSLQSCALSAETIEPTPEEAFYLRSMFDYVITCFDYDRTGMMMAKTLRKKYNFIPIMFTNGRFNTKDYEAKDAFEFSTSNDLFVLKTIIQELYVSNKKLIENNKLIIKNFKNE